MVKQFPLEINLSLSHSGLNQLFNIIGISYDRTSREGSFALFYIFGVTTRRLHIQKVEQNSLSLE